MGLSFAEWMARAKPYRSFASCSTRFAGESSVVFGSSETEYVSGNPPGAIAISDGSVREGRLDNEGFVRVDGLPRGNCHVSFPDLDREVF